jgi:hypothetical protein
MEHPGVTYNEEDRVPGTFKIRIGGSGDFVSKIDPYDRRCAPPGRVDVVAGWDNPGAMTFDSLDEALRHADMVWGIEGFHTSIERMHSNDGV